VRAAGGILKGAQLEVESIATMVGSESSIFRLATKKDFQDHSGEYQIIHLAMHSVVNNENPMLSTLYFSAAPGDTTESSHLTANDLYNMQLHADMAVLSACNTGFGKINRGEGIMSFARAFSFAGVNSAIISLWQVPDKATARLMVSFYQYLKEGKTKDVALQLAKKSFVRNYPQMAHPYYWSGFILSGNNDVISFPTDTRWWWIGGVLLILLAIAMWTIRKRILPGRL
jgi:CHAT domain-containing protein